MSNVKSGKVGNFGETKVFPQRNSCMEVWKIEKPSRKGCFLLFISFSEKCKEFGFKS